MTHTAPQGLPPLPKPDTHCLDDDTQRDVWSYSAELVQSYAREALAAQAATLESIHKIIECAGPDAAGEIADLLGYPSVEWPSDQALTAPNLACKSAQARLATQWGYVRAASVEPVGKIINSGGNTGSLPEHPLLVWLGGVPPVGTELYASAPPSPASVQNASLVEKLAKRTCEANADSARFTIALPQAQQGGGENTARAFTEWCKAQPEDRVPVSIDEALNEFEAALATKETKVCHSQNASQTPQADLSLTAAPQEWSPAYTRGPARQSAPVTAVPAMVQLTEEQMISAVRPLCNTGQVAERLVAVSIDEYRAIEAAIAKINGLTVGDKPALFGIHDDWTS